MLIGSHVFFAREGLEYEDDLETLIVGRNNKPPAASDVWEEVGIIRSESSENGAEAVDIWRPAPGRKVLDDSIISAQQLTLTYTVDEVSPLVYEMLHGANNIDPTTGGYVPLSQGSFVKGWFKAQQYDNNDILINVLDVYGVARLAGAVENGDTTTPSNYQLQIRVLRSPHNSGKVSNIGSPEESS